MKKFILLAISAAVALVLIGTAYATVCVQNNLTGEGSGRLSVTAYSGSGAVLDDTRSPVDGFFCTNTIINTSDFLEITITEIYYYTSGGTFIGSEEYFNNSSTEKVGFNNIPDPNTKYIIMVNGNCNSPGSQNQYGLDLAVEPTISVTASGGSGSPNDISAPVGFSGCGILRGTGVTEPKNLPIGPGTISGG